MAPLFGLDDIFDDAMADLDHLSLNVFVAADYSDFAADLIADGSNSGFTVGDGVWRVSDLIRHWPAQASIEPAQPSVQVGALYAALLFPDRTPWFVVPQLVDRAPEPG